MSLSSPSAAQRPRLRFFRGITTERLRRGVFSSVPELIEAIDQYIAHRNTNPKIFIWTKSARDILQKGIRANRRLSSEQNQDYTSHDAAQPAVIAFRRPRLGHSAHP